MACISSIRWSRIVPALLALAVLPILVGCGGQETEVNTALGSLPVAESALSTMAPDAKLLVIETANPVTTDSPPVWHYYFGTPKDNQMYLVAVGNGVVTQSHEVGESPLEKDEWSSVSDLDELKIDSDEAYDKALDASGVDELPLAYHMLLLTHVPRESPEDVQAQPFFWYVVLSYSGDPSVAPTIIKVDAESGDASEEVTETAE